MTSSPVFRRCGAMGKCVRHIVREPAEPADREPGALGRTHLKQSGQRFRNGSTNSPMPMPKSCSSVLQKAMPGAFPPGQLRTLQRRVKQWRSEIARGLVLGLESEAEIEREECFACAAIDPDGVRP